MRLIDHTFNDPRENIAIDELLFLKAEAGEMGETLRFWESPEYFVVLGRSCKLEEDCFADDCRERGIPIIRRASGGGTVLQGPGCLNYSLVLSYGSDGEYRAINGSYRAILGKICDEFRSKGVAAEFQPICDVSVDGKKVSGNAQARKKRFFLHHGTLLYGLDFDKVGAFLKHPPKEPAYRENRPHGSFLANIPLSSQDLKECVKRAFPVFGEAIGLSGEDLRGVAKLVSEKYSRDEWNGAF